MTQPKLEKCPRCKTYTIENGSCIKCGLAIKPSKFMKDIYKSRMNLKKLKYTYQKVSTEEERKLLLEVPPVNLIASWEEYQQLVLYALKVKETFNTSLANIARTQSQVACKTFQSYFNKSTTPSTYIRSRIVLKRYKAILDHYVNHQNQQLVDLSSTVLNESN
jgi:ribosomal protein L32